MMLENESKEQGPLDAKIKSPVSRATKKVEADMEALARSLQTFDARVTCKLLAVSREYLRQLLHARKLRGYYQGNRIRIPAWSIMEYQEKLQGRWRADEKRYSVIRSTDENRGQLKRAREMARRLRVEKMTVKESFQE